MYRCTSCKWQEDESPAKVSGYAGFDWKTGQSTHHYRCPICWHEAVPVEEGETIINYDCLDIHDVVSERSIG